MFDFGFSEMLLVALIALLVLGPERLPRAARTLGLWLRRARASWYSVRAEFERELADDDLKRSLKAAGEEARALGRELDAAVRTPDGAVATPPSSATPAPAAKREP